MLVMTEGDISRVLFPGLPIYLHGDRLGEEDSDLTSLTHTMGLAEANLHLGDVETGEDTEDLQLPIGDGGREVEVFMSAAQTPRPDPRSPAGDVEHHH